jgi:hypothetical protein
VEPYEGDAEDDLGLFYLYIKVPREAPPFRLPPTDRGEIRIEFDHPRVRQLVLPVDLIITPRPRNIINP